MEDTMSKKFDLNGLLKQKFGAATDTNEYLDSLLEDAVKAAEDVEDGEELEEDVDAVEGSVEEEGRVEVKADETQKEGSEVKTEKKTVDEVVGVEPQVAAEDGKKADAEDKKESVESVLGIEDAVKEGSADGKKDEAVKPAVSVDGVKEAVKLAVDELMNDTTTECSNRELVDAIKSVLSESQKEASDEPVDVVKWASELPEEDKAMLKEALCGVREVIGDKYAELDDEAKVASAIRLLSINDFVAQNMEIGKAAVAEEMGESAKTASDEDITEKAVDYLIKAAQAAEEENEAIYNYGYTLGKGYSDAVNGL